MIPKHLSIVKVDKRPHRQIAQENWNLTDEQMHGKHVHHRVKRCDGGTNDPSNLYVCSPSMHRWGWHDGEEWIEWASEGGKLGAESCKTKRETDPSWAEAERKRNQKRAKRSHELGKGTPEYSDRQRQKSLRSHPVKRRDWSESTYDMVWEYYLRGVDSGYKVSKRSGLKNTKQYSNMLKFASLGYSYSQLLDVEEYLEECKRLEEHPLAHLISSYDD